MKSAWLFPALEGTKASVENDPRGLSVDWRVRFLPLVRLRLTGPKVGALPRTTAARGIARWRTGREQEQKQTPSHWYSIVFLRRNSHHEISYSLQKISIVEGSLNSKSHGSVYSIYQVLLILIPWDRTTCCAETSHLRQVQVGRFLPELRLRIRGWWVGISNANA